MFKKVMGLTLGLLLGMTLFATPAHAEHFGTRCDDTGVWLGGKYRSIADVCAIVNQPDLSFSGPEGLASVRNTDPGNYFGTIEWRFDWVHLYRDGTLHEAAGPTGWMWPPNTSFSTDWGTCGAQNNREWRAPIRYQVRAQKNGEWHSQGWVTLSSATVTLC